MRIWFAAFGIGVPALLLSHPEMKAAAVATRSLKAVLIIFFSGLLVQVVVVAQSSCQLLRQLNLDPQRKIPRNHFVGRRTSFTHPNKWPVCCMYRIISNVISLYKPAHWTYAENVRCQCQYRTDNPSPSCAISYGYDAGAPFVLLHAAPVSKIV